jgi:hypothetical protein
MSQKINLVEEVQWGKTPLNKIPWKEYLHHKFPYVPVFDVDDNGRLTEDAAIKLREFSSEAVENMCDTCQKNQIAEHGEIVIKCSGLASVNTVLPEEIKHNFSPKEIQQFEEVANPYAWADKYIDPESSLLHRIFSPRWYQEQMTRCTANRKAYRCGRRTGKTYSFALNILHRVLTNDDYKVLIVTPYEVQAEELITQVKEFIYKLDPNFGTYDTLVTKDVKSPNYLVKFSNGSRIRGFTTGASGAGSVRGQSADLIVLDEVDYMTDADFNSVLAILADNPDTELWVASTPDAKKSLYRLEQIPEYKKFHFPTFVLPHYSDALDKDFKNQLTDVGYVQEIMAEFGASEMGVFQAYYVDRCTNQDMSQAQRDDVLENRDRYIVIMGCDWNDDAVGTRIQIVAFDKVNKKFFIAEKATVSKEGWSQVEAVNKIIELNRKYEFDHMYVDEGFGTSQIQFIKKYAIDQYGKIDPKHPDLKLANVVGINFSSKIEVLDQNGGEMLKKDCKVYMVENTVRFLERESYILDPDYDKDLIAQMYNYIIKGRSPTGRPTFCAEEEKIGDHDLDAFMLAILGFAMEYSEFLNIEYANDIIHLVSREAMDGAKKEFGDPFEIYTDHLFANPNTSYQQKRGSALFKNRINGYNRADFGGSKRMTGFSVPEFKAYKNKLPSVGGDGLMRSDNPKGNKINGPKRRASF